MPFDVRISPLGHICAHPRLTPGESVTVHCTARRMTHDVHDVHGHSREHLSFNLSTVSDDLQTSSWTGAHRLHSAQLKLCLTPGVPLLTGLDFSCSSNGVGGAGIPSTILRKLMSSSEVMRILRGGSGVYESAAIKRSNWEVRVP